jgi:hypothetical protein
MRRALLVGFATYDELSALPCCAADVGELRAVLADNARGDFDVVQTITGRTTQAGLERAVAELFAANDADLLVFYFTGHGLVTQSGELLLALPITDGRALATTTLAFSRVMELLDTSRAHNVVVILDCCYSGAAGAAIPQVAAERPFARATTGPSSYVLASSLAGQESWQSDSGTLSVFTGCLLAGMATGEGDHDSDGMVSIDEAFAHAHDLIGAAGRQTPVRFVSNARDTPWITRNPYRRTVDLTAYDTEYLRRAFAVRNMRELLDAEPESRFHVGLRWNYIIEDEVYGANALTVSRTHTPNLVPTQEGFECDAFFKPGDLTDHAKDGKTPINDLIRVRMRVELDKLGFIVGMRGDGADVALLPFPPAST